MALLIYHDTVWMKEVDRDKMNAAIFARSNRAGLRNHRSQGRAGAASPTQETTTASRIRVYATTEARRVRARSRKRLPPQPDEPAMEPSPRRR